MNSPRQATLDQLPLPACSCHVIDLTKTRLILWPTGQTDNPYVLRLNNQKFIAYNCVDRNGQAYYRFRELQETNPTAPAPSSASQPANTPINPPEPSLGDKLRAKLAEKAAESAPFSPLTASQLAKIAKFHERQNQALNQKKDESPPSGTAEKQS